MNFLPPRKNSTRKLDTKPGFKDEIRCHNGQKRGQYAGEETVGCPIIEQRKHDEKRCDKVTQLIEDQAVSHKDEYSINGREFRQSQEWTIGPVISLGIEFRELPGEGHDRPDHDQGETRSKRNEPRPGLPE